jgi:hypothetical protein
MDDQ